MEELSGERSINGYKLVKVIGKGAYGQVWLSLYREKRQYVLKKINWRTANWKERDAVRLECDLLAKLKHPNVVQYKDSFENEGFMYISMGYCEGGDLHSKLTKRAGKLLEEKQIVEWFVQISMAIEYLHERNILHRDLKTQNIFLTKSALIKVGDFGIARVLNDHQDMARTIIGTPYYMSPELFAGKPYNHKSDIWALGCVVYEMTTLKHAFNAKDMNSLSYKILKGKLPVMPRKYGTDLVEIMKVMLRQDPEERPSASDILRNEYIQVNIRKFLEYTNMKANRNDSNSSPPSSALIQKSSKAQSPSPLVNQSENTPKSPKKSSEQKLPTPIPENSSASSLKEEESTEPNRPSQDITPKKLELENSTEDRGRTELERKISEIKRRNFSEAKDSMLLNVNVRRVAGKPSSAAVAPPVVVDHRTPAKTRDKAFNENSKSIESLAKAAAEAGNYSTESTDDADVIIPQNRFSNIKDTIMIRADKRNINSRPDKQRGGSHQQSPVNKMKQSENRRRQSENDQRAKQSDRSPPDEWNWEGNSDGRKRRRQMRRNQIRTAHPVLRSCDVEKDSDDEIISRIVLQPKAATQAPPKHIRRQQYDFDEEQEIDDIRRQNPRHYRNYHKESSHDCHHHYHHRHHEHNRNPRRESPSSSHLRPDCRVHRSNMNREDSEDQQEIFFPVNSSSPARLNKDAVQQQQSVDDQLETDDLPELVPIDHVQRNPKLQSSPSQSDEMEIDNMMTLMGETLKIDHQRASNRQRREKRLEVNDQLKQPSANEHNRRQSPIEREEETVGRTIRMNDQYVEIRKELVKTLGVRVLRDAWEILDNLEDDEHEQQMLRLLGESNYKQFISKIVWLKFTEDHQGLSGFGSEQRR